MSKMLSGLGAIFSRPLLRTGPWMPRTLQAKDGSPFDMDAGERITRQKTGLDIWPMPPLIGYASPFMPQATAFLFSQGTAIPIAMVNTELGNAFNLQNQIVVPGLQKQG